MELNCCVCGMEIYFNLNSQRNEKVEFFSLETFSFQILGNETLIITGLQRYKISIFHLLAVKL